MWGGEEVGFSQDLNTAVPDTSYRGPLSVELWGREYCLALGGRGRWVSEFKISQDYTDSETLSQIDK